MAVGALLICLAALNLLQKSKDVTRFLKS